MKNFNTIYCKNGELRIISFQAKNAKKAREEASSLITSREKKSSSFIVEEVKK